MVVFAFVMPATANHFVLMAFINLTLICFWLHRDDWFEAAIPHLRTLVIIAYGFAFFHKLNWDFINPKNSCVISMLAGDLPLFTSVSQVISENQWMKSVLIYLTLVVEFLIPFFLVRPKWAKLGIALGSLFHLSLGPRFLTISTVFLAAYFLWLKAKISRWALAILAIVGGPVLFGLEVMTVKNASTPLEYVYTLAGVVCFLFVGGYFYLLLNRGLSEKFIDVKKSTSRVAIVLSVTLIFLCLNPYLGLRTLPAFSMFSNLRTEGGQSNHLLFSKSPIEFFDYQRDLVSIVSSSDSQFNSLEAQSVLLPYPLFLRILKDRGDLPPRTVYQYKSQQFLLTEEKLKQLIEEGDGWLFNKYLLFRSVLPDNNCHW
mgnify:CR=1 FL=1